MTEMSSPRKGLSATRGVQLEKIRMVKPTQAALTQWEADIQTTVHITLRFSYPILRLRGYKKSESACTSSFVPIVIPVQGGKLASAEFLLNEIFKDYGIDEDYGRETLSIWLLSDLMELQLKPHHSPFEVASYWQPLLKKFSNASSDDIMYDVPIVMIRRAVHLPLWREREIVASCPKIREIMFNDAYEAFMSGRYNASAEECATLAGLGLAVVFEPYCSDRHTIDFLRQDMESFVPRHLVSTVRGPLLFGKAISGPNALETLLLHAWRDASSDASEVHLQFLEMLYDKPFYGAAYFTGAVEQPRKKWNMAAPTDAKVIIGINHSYISVVEDAKKENLLVQRLCDCNWRKAVPDPAEKDLETSLLITFPNEDGENVDMLQIFGKEAPLMEALLDSMKAIVEYELEDSDEEDLYDSVMQSGHENEAYSVGPSTSQSLWATTQSAGDDADDCADGSSCIVAADDEDNDDADEDRREVSRAPSMTKKKKMCVATFTASGTCLQAPGSLKVVFTEAKNWK